MFRVLLLVAFCFASCTVGQAAELKKLVVKCIEKAEATPDDVFLEFVADGKPVVFGKEHQTGTSRDNTHKMADGDVLTLDPGTLARLNFTQTLEIHIKDKDITRDEPIGMMKLAPGDISETYVSKGKDVGAFEYHVDYTTTK
jgi:hypothetical protein